MQWFMAGEPLSQFSWPSVWLNSSRWLYVRAVYMKRESWPETPVNPFTEVV